MAVEVGEVVGFWTCFCVWLNGFSNVEGEREKGRSRGLP